MKKRLLVLVVWIAAVFLLFTSPYLAWKVIPSRDLRIVVVDKTVPFENYKEHASLFWALNHWKFPPPGGGAWDEATSYVGYYPSVRSGGRGADVLKGTGPTPEKPWRLLRRDDLIDRDLLYIADTYGVYELDLEHTDEMEAHLVRNDVVFGGLVAEELALMEEFTQQGRTIVGEFNAFALPTDEGVRDRAERLFHVEWTGWVGRYIDDLGNMDDIPNWIPYLYELQYGANWTFHGPGFVFVDTQERIVVLEVRPADRINPDVGERLIRIRKTADADDLLKGASDDVPYYYWFDVTIADSQAKVHAEYVLDVTPEGEAKLRQFGIPSFFPAVVSYSGAYRSYYFAGDFADNAVVFGPHEFAFYPAYRRKFPRYREYHTNEWFYWEFYLPLLDALFAREENAFYGGK